MVSTRPLISKSSRLFNNPLVTVPRAPIIIGINITFIFQSFFNSLARFFFQFYSMVSPDSKVHNSASFLYFIYFLLIIIRSGRLAEIKWSVCMSKCHRSMSHSRPPASKSSSPFSNPVPKFIIIVIIIIILFWEFSHQRLLMVFHWSLSVVRWWDWPFMN